MTLLELAAEFSVLGEDSENDDVLEKKIEDIRRDVLPPYPDVPDLTAARLPPRNFKQPTTSHAQSRLEMRAHVAAVPRTSAPASPLTLPVPPAMSPGKSSRSMRRKSVRFSMARQRSGRPSMFRVFSGQLDDEVDKVGALPMLSPHGLTIIFDTTVPSSWTRHMIYRPTMRMRANTVPLSRHREDSPARACTASGPRARQHPTNGLLGQHTKWDSPHRCGSLAWHYRYRLGLFTRIQKMTGTRERRPGQCGTGMRRHARRGSAE